MWSVELSSRVRVNAKVKLTVKVLDEGNDRLGPGNEPGSTFLKQLACGDGDGRGRRHWKGDGAVVQVNELYLSQCSGRHCTGHCSSVRGMGSEGPVVCITAMAVVRVRVGGRG